MRKLATLKLKTMLRTTILLLVFSSILINDSLFAGKLYTPQSFTISGSGTFCQSNPGTTTLNSSLTYATGNANCGVTGGGNPDLNAPVTYQWYLDTDNILGGGSIIVGATGSTYNAPITASGTFYYYCIVSWVDPDGAGACTAGSISTGNLTVIVSDIPTTANAGSDFTTGGCVTTATLAGNTPIVGTGTWTIISGPGSITSPNSPTSGVTGLQAGIATTFRWTITNSPCASSSDDVIITGGACASPDLCSGAIAVSCNNTYTGTTVGMTADTGLPGCGTSPGTGGSVWYVLAGTGGAVTASLCGSSYDTKINVYSGTSCASLAGCVASNDDFCGLQSEVTFTTTIGTNYYILVNGFGSETGNYTLNISCCTGTAPSCASNPFPANAAMNVSTCNTFTWTAPPAGACSPATGYDIYFGTTNPPPFITNVGTTSYTPSLNGNTTYYWQVRPTNGSGQATGCSIWSFTTNANNQYNLVDDATSPAPFECVTITPAVNDQRGCAWDQNSTLSFASDFTYDWTINLGSNDGGADGMTFVIQNDPLGRCKCGNSGEFLGAGGIQNSLIIEIDTYLNSRDRDDGLPTVVCSGGPDPDHIDLWLNGNINPSTDGNDCLLTGSERIIPNAIPLLNAGVNYNIENGLDHKLRVTWNAGSSTITVSILNNAGTTTYGTLSYGPINPMTLFGTNNPYFGFTGSTGGLNNQQTFCNPPVLLPVTMGDFNMVCDEGFVTLNWNTSSEINNDFFTIERSSDGENFEILSTIDGAGNSNQPLFYSWQENTRFEELKYYRLSQTDFNGEIKILNTIATNCTEINGTNIISTTYESGILTLNIENKIQTDYQIEIIDMSGKIVYIDRKYIPSGATLLNLGRIEMTKGIYYIRLSSFNELISKKIAVF
ncbi:MAG: T9SS type A sorting domain-containing protein [Bacteroidetes bacterium]|nr:MAG: T9SS type A sorting domain-containing protein [Bacteroidota bacterium]